MIKMKAIKRIFWFIWGLPQNIFGLILYSFCYIKSKKNPKASQGKINDSYYCSVPGNGSAISLGMFIIVFGIYEDYTHLLKHEYGHSIQSKILGPLYFIIIGLPSIIWAGCFKGYRKTMHYSYYWFYTEKWANKLGGVE